MNPYSTNQYVQQMMQQMAQQPQSVPMPLQHVKEQIISYPGIDSPEQLSTLPPVPNTIYLGLNLRDGKIYMRRMNNDGLMDVKTFSVTTEQTKKTDNAEILDRLTKIESNQIDIQSIMDQISKLKSSQTNIQAIADRMAKLEKKIGGKHESTNDFNFDE